MQQGTVALRERGRLATLLSHLWHDAGQQPGWHEPDRRHTRTWRQVVLAVLVKRSTRLVTVGQAVFDRGQWAAQRVKAVAMGLAAFLTTAKFPAATLSPLVLAAAVRHLDPAHLATSRGQALLVLDPTE